MWNFDRILVEFRLHLSRIYIKFKFKNDKVSALKKSQFSLPQFKLLSFDSLSFNLCFLFIHLAKQITQQSIDINSQYKLKQKLCNRVVKKMFV